MLSIFVVLQQEPVLFYTSVVVFSLLIGSFLNVVIHRLPLMMKQEARQDCSRFLAEEFPESLSESEREYVSSPNQDASAQEKYNLVVPRSACPHCGHQITALENIPIISYLVLRGKCRNCDSKISIRYPFVEALSAVFVFIVALKFGVSDQLLFAAFFTWSVLALTFIDLDTQYLPDQITLPLLWLGLLINLDNTFTDIQSAILGAAAGYLSLWLVYKLFKLITNKEGMGYGDFKLLAMIGAWCGWQAVPAVILISSVIGSIVGISLILIKYHEKGKPIPFGPYLAGAGWLVLLWGNDINDFYLKLFL